jgi:hypothetical protein
MIWLLPIAVPSVASCVLTVISVLEETVTTSVTAANLERQIDRRGRVDEGLDSGGHRFLETLRLDLEHILTRWERRDDECPVALRGAGTGDVSRLVPDRYRGAGNDLPLRVQIVPRTLDVPVCAEAPAADIRAIISTPNARRIAD